jgi:hypothetical protein
VLKLIYHNAAFGPIDLEYDRSAIRVGSSEDNDLVLRHPSVKPHHCVLLFRDEKLVWLPPDPAISAEIDLRSLTGPEFDVGDHLQIGDLLFNVARSSRSVSIPTVSVPQMSAEAAGTDPAAAAEPDRNRYFCPHCRVVYQRADLKRVGLVGHPKRWLCPRCSHVFEVEPEAPKPAPNQSAPGPRKWLRRSPAHG